MAHYAVILSVMLVCLCSLSHESSQNVRNKRHVEDASIQSVLQSFISRIDAMKRLIRNQNVMIREQKRSIKSLKWQIRRKGTQERLDEIDRDVKHQTILLKDDIDVASLRAFKLSVDKAEAKLNRTSKSIKIRAKVISDMYFRLIMKDRRIDCKVFYTKWNKQADYKIGYLDKHLIECPNQEFLQEFLFERRAGGLDSDVRYKYRCCRYNIKDKWIPKPKND